MFKIGFRLPRQKAYTICLYIQQKKSSNSVFQYNALLLKAGITKNNGNLELKTKANLPSNDIYYQQNTVKCTVGNVRREH